MAMKDGIKNYRDMMKRMEGMGEEKIPARENMGMDSLMPQLKNDMIKPRMKPTGVGATSDAELKMMEEMQSGAGSMSDDEMMAMRNREAMNMQGNMSGAMSDAESEMITKILGKSAPSDLKLAMEALMQLGLSETQILDLLSSTDGLASVLTPDGRIDANPRSMTEGALGSLPQRTTPTEMRPESFGADRTQSMEMQKEAMGT